MKHARDRGYRGIPAEALIAGSVEEVIEQFRSFGKLGYTDILVRHLTNDQPKGFGLAGAAGSGARGTRLGRILLISWTE